MVKWSVRREEFVGEREYTQLEPIRWEDIVVECNDDEEVFFIDTRLDQGSSMRAIPVLVAWIRRRVE